MQIFVAAVFSEAKLEAAEEEYFCRWRSSDLRSIAFLQAIVEPRSVASSTEPVDRARHRHGRHARVRRERRDLVVELKGLHLKRAEKGSDARARASGISKIGFIRWRGSLN